MLNGKDEILIFPSCYDLQRILHHNSHQLLNSLLHGKFLQQIFHLKHFMISQRDDLERNINE
ncbi:CLUMA_CG001015, isoform A [Clunio marinus]|uniref:CLUMA_CG001015, isoform A n=1 Tax=Clunio marinus TaxID=568069 RepID=A0A1J1HH50_9DIPT|nr:CLUMA_CG001015, isoform A [Clunio marinus]